MISESRFISASSECHRIHSPLLRALPAAQHTSRCRAHAQTHLRRRAALARKSLFVKMSCGASTQGAASDTIPSLLREVADLSASHSATQAGPRNAGRVLCETRRTTNPCSLAKGKPQECRELHPAPVGVRHTGREKIEATEVGGRADTRS
jgi:hypothetical protein